MKTALLLASLTIGATLFASEILPSHAGSFRCRCLHEGCKESSLTEVELLLDQVHDRLVINYGDEIQSGAPARTSHRGGAVTYTLASRGTVGFSSNGEMKFGWGKLWTCKRTP